MTVYVALLRAVNVGGTGKLSMADLKALCEKAEFTKVRTYIASGNVIFQSAQSAAAVKKVLEASLEKYAGKRIGVLVRTADEMAKVLAANPFPNAPSNLTVAVFLDGRPPANTMAGITGRKRETLELGKREIYVQYPDGQGTSKLKIPAAAAGTARNMNTVAKLAALAAGL